MSQIEALFQNKYLDLDLWISDSSPLDFGRISAIYMLAL